MKLPSISPNTPLGDYKSYASSPLNFLQEKQKIHGDIFSFRLAYRKMNFVNDPNCIQRILQENNRNYIKSIAYQKLGLLLGNGLFTSEGDFWRRQRRLSQPLFHKAEIAGYEKIMIDATNRMVDKWKNQDTISLQSEMTYLTLEIITEALLGLSLSDEATVIEEHMPSLLQKMIKRIVSAFNVPLWFPTKSNRQFNHSVAVLKQLMSELIKSKEEQGLGHDLLSSLMKVRDEDDTSMTHQQLQDEIMTFFMAGHETTAVTACWIFYLLKTNPQVESKLIESIGENDTSYLDLIIQESLRFYSPVWVLGRESINNDQLGDFEISGGESIIFSPYMIHRHPDFWDRPNEFLPERFENFKATHKYSYFPFGGGPRLCIGNHFALLELETMIKILYQNFRFNVQDSSFPDFDFSLTLRPKKPIILGIQKF